MSIAKELFLLSRPRSRHAHWQRITDSGQLLVTNGSRLFEVDHEVLGDEDRLRVAARLADQAPSAHRVVQVAGGPIYFYQVARGSGAVRAAGKVP